MSERECVCGHNLSWHLSDPDDTDNPCDHPECDCDHYVSAALDDAAGDESASMEDKDDA